MSIPRPASPRRASPSCAARSPSAPSPRIPRLSTPSSPPAAQDAADKGTQRVTAANASGINDGAAAIVLASGEAVAKYGLKPMAKLIGWGQGGVDPKIMGVGPVPASRAGAGEGRPDHR